MKKMIFEPEIQTDKSLGQHFLFDQTVLSLIVDFADVESGDTVLEIGPGLGTLTAVLIQKAGAVVAVEFDKDLAEKLKSSLSDLFRQSKDKLDYPNESGNDKIQDNLQVINADFLQFDLNNLPKNYKVVANIPYYITAKIVRKLLTAENKPKSVTLLVQKEVAERIAADAGDLSILAVSAQVYAKVSLGPIVGRQFFTPPPKVDSQVVKMELYEKSLVADLDEADFFRIVKMGFSSPRKKVLKNLAGGLHVEPDKIATIFAKLNISENARAEDITIENWREIVINLKEENL
ncbi:MAG: 16S rRNA (adenine(1518)-N(6)/adenine(1519)-N(6))-dimethyltransferase RsmA [Candidatus Nomurabacteria bacterium]|nr:16S rRNA (adenine(1518)-N(6)/adenine(1519)-N(6))-dimethyltransferase RsmA [Candidatus Nomurabacteria bacterium]